MKRFMTTTALGLVLATVPAMAQTTDTNRHEKPQTEQMKPGSGEDNAGVKIDSQPATEDTQNVRPPKERADSPAVADNQTEVAKFSGYRASELIGVNVENTRGDNVGEINDIILGQDGETNAVLIGVGGFLGIGEKNVAVPFSDLTLKKADGSLKANVAMTAQTLESMPAYEQNKTEGDSKESTGSSDQTKR